MATLPEDVKMWVESMFPSENLASALALLVNAADHTGKDPGPRLLRSAAAASKGDLEKLFYYVDLLRIDWRDVIVAGEYDIVDGKLVRARDFSRPMTVD